jgi:hypothetical protein
VSVSFVPSGLVIVIVTFQPSASVFAISRNSG